MNHAPTKTSTNQRGALSDAPLSFIIPAFNLNLNLNLRLSLTLP